jgi:hypothetical protein
LEKFFERLLLLLLLLLHLREVATAEILCRVSSFTWSDQKSSEGGSRGEKGADQKICGPTDRPTPTD